MFWAHLGQSGSPHRLPIPTAPGRPTLAVRGFHLSAPSTSIARLGGRPNLGSPLEPHSLSGRPPHAYWAATLQGGSPQFGPHCGRPLSAPPRHRPPITISPDASGHKNRMYRGTACTRPLTSAGRYGCALCALMDARICARNVGPRICGDKQKPPPLKG